jgi:hypothetical protein
MKQALLATIALAVMLGLAGCPPAEIPNPPPAVSSDSATLELILDLFVELLTGDQAPVASARSLAGGAQSIKHNLPVSSIVALKNRILEYIRERGLNESRRLKDLLPALTQGAAVAMQDESVVGSMTDSEKSTLNALVTKSLVTIAQDDEVRGSATDAATSGDTQQIIESVTAQAVKNIQALQIEGSISNAVQEIVIVVIVAGNETVSDQALIQARVKAVVGSASASLDGIVTGGNASAVLKNLVDGAVTALGETALPADAAEEALRSSVLQPVLASALRYTQSAVDTAGIIDAISLQNAIDALATQNAALAAQLRSMQEQLDALKLAAQQAAVVEVTNPDPIKNDFGNEDLVGTWKAFMSWEYIDEWDDGEGTPFSIRIQMNAQQTIKVSSAGDIEINAVSEARFPDNPGMDPIKNYSGMRGSISINSDLSTGRVVYTQERPPSSSPYAGDTGWVEITAREFIAPYLLVDGKLVYCTYSKPYTYILKEASPIADGSLIGSFFMEAIATDSEDPTPAVRMELELTDTEWTYTVKHAPTLAGLASTSLVESTNGTYSLDGSRINLLVGGHPAEDLPDHFRRIGDYLLFWEGAEPVSAVRVSF